MAGWKQFPGLEGAIYYYWGFPKNAVNDWLVTEYKKKNNGTPPDFFVAGGMAAALAVVAAVKKAKSTDSEKLIAAMEGMKYEGLTGTQEIRKSDHQVIKNYYLLKGKAKSKMRSKDDYADIISFGKSFLAPDKTMCKMA